MPIPIQIKRGDSDYLNVHLLDDGELAIVRKWLIDGGPQDGEYTYFWGMRIGDGTNNGGQDGLSSPMAAAITNALAHATNALSYSRTLSKDGNYQPQYLKWWNDLASEDTDYLKCIVPDPASTNFHLGTGTLLYNGAIIDWKVSDQFRFLTDCTWSDDSTVYYHAALDRITSYDVSEITGDSTVVDVIGIRESIQQQTASAYYANAKFIGIQASVWNESSATAMPIGIGFDAEYGFYKDSSEHGINQRVSQLIGYNVSTLENDWDISGDYVGNLIGFNIEDQTAGSFDGTFSGFRIGLIKSNATAPIFGIDIVDIGETTNSLLTTALHVGDVSASETDGTSHAIDIAHVYGNIVRGLRINSMGSTDSSRVEGISISNIGSTITTGTSTAIGLLNETVGSTGCNIAIGYKNTNIISGNVAYGIFMDNIEGDLLSRGIHLTNIGTYDSTTNDGIYLGHVGVDTDNTSYDAINVGLSIYQIGCEYSNRSHGIRSAIISSNMTDGTSIGFEASSIIGATSRGMQLYTIGGTDTTESRGIVVNNVGITATISTAISTGYYANIIGNSDGGCAAAHGMLINNILSDATAHGIEIADVNADSQSRGVIIWNVGNSNSLYCQGYAASTVGTQSTNASARCIGFLVDYAGNQDNGIFSSFVRGFQSASDETAHGIDMTLISGKHESRGIWIDQIGHADSTRTHGITISNIGRSTTNTDNNAVGAMLGNIGNGPYANLACVVKAFSVDADATAHGFEVASITAEIVRGIKFVNLGDGETLHASALWANNIGADFGSVTAEAYGVYFGNVGTRALGTMSAALHADYIYGKTLAHGIDIDTITADFVRGVVIDTLGDSASTGVQGLYFNQLGTAMTSATSRAIGAYFKTIGGSGVQRTLGIKLESLVAGNDGTCHGIEINSVSGNVINRGIIVYGSDNVDATWNHAFAGTNIGVSSTNVEAYCNGLLIENVGRHDGGSGNPGNRFGFGARFLNIASDSTTIGVDIGGPNGLIGKSLCVGLNICDLDSESDGTCDIITGINISQVGMTNVDYSDIISVMNIGSQIGKNNVDFSPVNETESYTYMINASTTSFKNIHNAVGIHIKELDGTTSSVGFQIDSVGLEDQMDSTVSYGIKINGVYGINDVCGIRINKVKAYDTEAASTMIAGLYIGDCEANDGSDRAYAIHTNDTDNITTPGLTCLFLPQDSAPAGSDIGTLYVDSTTGQVYARIS